MDWSKIIKNYSLGLLSLVGIIAIAWLAGYKTNFPTPTQRSNPEFMAAISKTHKELFTKDGQPIFKIAKVEKPTPNWYILHLDLTKGNGPTSILIISDPHFGSEYMKVIIGPENRFARNELIEKSIPGVVINSLRSEGDL